VLHADRISYVRERRESLLVVLAVERIGSDVAAPGAGLVAREGRLEDVLVAAAALREGVAQGGDRGEEDDQPLNPHKDAEGGEFLAPLDRVGEVARNNAAVHRYAVPAGGREGVEGQPEDAEYREHTDLKLGTTGVRVVGSKVEDGHQSKQHESYDGKDEGEAIGDEEIILVLVDPGGEGKHDDIYEEEENVGGHLRPAYR